MQYQHKVTINIQDDLGMRRAWQGFVYSDKKEDRTLEEWPTIFHLEWSIDSTQEMSDEEFAELLDE